MSDFNAAEPFHRHDFLGANHTESERRIWGVIYLCGAMMIIEILGGLLYGSIALVADGLHMSTHAGAMLLAALAYTYARRHTENPRFTFGTGKLGDLAGFTSAIILAMIALLIAYEAVSRLLSPISIHFTEAIPIAVLGLVVNIISAWMLGAGHHHDHGHSHAHGHSHSHAEHGASDHGDEKLILTAAGMLKLSIFEDGVPPRFRVSLPPSGSAPFLEIETIRPTGERQIFHMVHQGSYLESVEEIPEPHAFTANVLTGDATHQVSFEEHAHDDHDHAHRDNNMRAAVVHVLADAAVSVLVILGLLLAMIFGWTWMDPLAGLVGALVIASWSWGLIRDTGAVLLDMNPDPQLHGRIRSLVEVDGDRLRDLHVWRLGPGHLGAILSVQTASGREVDFYRGRLGGVPSLSHVTIEIHRR